jgi:hypothetical protein
VTDRAGLVGVGIFTEDHALALKKAAKHGWNLDKFLHEAINAFPDPSSVAVTPETTVSEPRAIVLDGERNRLVEQHLHGASCNGPDTMNPHRGCARK